MSKITFNKGDVIFKAGEKGTSMFRIITGTVGIYANYGETGEKCLVELSAGKHFGEMAMIEDLPRSATAVANEWTEIESISKDEFNGFVAANPTIAIAIMKNLSSRLRGLTTDYMDACKTLAEVMESEDGKSKKGGLWDKIKKFAQVYAEATSYAYGYIGDNNESVPYYFGAHYPMFFD